MERGYLDILLSRRPSVRVDFEHAFELKYLPAGADDAAVSDSASQGEEQIRLYLGAASLGEREGLLGWVVVFRGATAPCCDGWIRLPGQHRHRRPIPGRRR